MQRREYIVGAVGLGALLAGGAYATLGDVGGANRIAPAEVKLLNADGSPGSTLTVPVPDTYTVLDLFTYGCGECQKQFQTLRAAEAVVGDAARFVSVHPSFMVDDVEQPTPVLEFWSEHGGDWAMGLDPGDHFHDGFGKPAFPFTAVIDPDGRVVWSATGVTDPGPIESAVGSR